MKSYARAAASTGGILLLAAMNFLGQARQTAQPPLVPPSSVVVGSGNFSPIVQDLERSLAFYSDLVGAMPPATPAWSEDPVLLNFLGVPGAQLRFANVRIPGSAMQVEIVEFKNIDRKATQPRLQDPGATRLILIVRDVNALITRLKAKGVPIVTAGGAPVTINAPKGKALAAMIKDPDGFFVELLQPETIPETTVPATSNVVDAAFGLTISNMDQTVRLYRDVLGFMPAASPTDKAIPGLMGVGGGEAVVNWAVIPGSRVLAEFVEFRGGPNRTPHTPRIQDQGATRLQLRVANVDAAVNALKAAGGTVITTGGDGGPIDMRGLRVALVREPNNLFLVILGQAQGARRGQ